MKADITHDYNEMPREEIENSKEVLQRADNYKFVEVVRKPDQNIGLDENVNMAVILYEEV